MHALSDKTAVVIGGTQGIGLAVARNYADCGARVYICGRRDASETAAGIGATAKQVDVTDEASLKALFADVEAEAGRFHVLVVTAGIAEDVGPLAESPSEFMRRCIDVNLFGPYYALKHAPGHMTDGGSIITTGSTAGSGTTTAGYSEYASSKAGVAYLTRTVAIELAPREIRVNAVCPAVIADTGMMVPDDGSPEAVLYGTLTAFGRMGRLDEVTGIYNFLASDASTFITGQEIRVDGGMTAGFGLPVMGRLTG